MIKKNILIVSATSNNNLKLSNDIYSLIKNSDLKSLDIEILNLEDYSFPIFTESFFDKNKNKYLDDVKIVTNKIIDCDGLILCGPEYNGSITPIINNSIAWISMSTDYWRDAFLNKIGLICTHSGGDGAKFLSSMKLQLEHLGVTVMPRYISVTNSKEFNNESAYKILKHFINLL